MLALFHRFTALLPRTAALCLLATLVSVPAPAQAQLATAPQSGVQLMRLEVLHNAPPGLSLAQVQSGEAGAFVAQSDLHISHPHWYRALWLRLHLKLAPNPTVAPDQAVLFFPKPYLDDLRLYTPGKQNNDAWTVQQAGDFIAPKEWSVRSLHPKFLLPSAQRMAALEGQSMELYVQIEHLAPVMLGVNMKDAKEAFDEDALSLLLYGLGLGAMLISALLSAALAWIHRDAAYAGYSFYASAALLACASHSGIAHHVLWPIAGPWPGTAVFSFLMISCVGQLQFARCVYAANQSHRGLYWAAHSVSAACLAIMFCFPIFGAFWQTMYFGTLTLFAITSLIAVLFMLHGWRMGNKLAHVWLLAYLPLGATVVVALLEGVGLLPSTHGSYRLLILAVCLEVLILGLALQWFARERHGQQERALALASTDPLTGFATEETFRNHLARDWQALASASQDTAVVYVQLRNAPSNAQTQERLLLRSVRVLRAATRSQDMVARLEGSMLALLMPGLGLGDDVSQRLSRIIALGLMPDSSDSRGGLLQFRIAYTTRHHYQHAAQQLDSDLKALLAEERRWGSRPIRVIDHKRTAQSRSRSVIDSAALDDVWDQALAQQQAELNAEQDAKLRAKLQASASRSKL